MDFSWHCGEWRYKSIAECPGELTSKDIEGNRQTLRRVEVDQAEETLGIYLAPSGSKEGQISKLLGKVQQWNEHISDGRLTKLEIWSAVQSTILRTLAYPLPALHLSRKEWDSILSPLMGTVLPRLGICRTFPRAMVFAPLSFLVLDSNTFIRFKKSLELRTLSTILQMTLLQVGYTGHHSNCFLFNSDPFYPSICNPLSC